MSQSIRSMTGYGSGSAKVPGAVVTVEVKSVNQRFLDVGMKGPREYFVLERQLIEKVRQVARRGKVDIFINKNPDSSDPHAVQVDVGLARGYYKALCELGEVVGLKEKVSLPLVAEQRGVLSVGALAPNPESDAQGVEAAMQEALDTMVQMREEEGVHLCGDLESNISRLVEFLAELEARIPQIVSAHQVALQERVTALLGDQSLDEARLAQEIAVLADRIDVHEEIVRMKSHLDQLTQLVEQGGEVGRRLDFLLQEIFRETNTTGSKVNDAKASQLVVEMKAILERLREQAQNVE